MFVALHLPDLPVVAALYGLPAEKRQQPCAVLFPGMGKQEALRLRAVNQAARHIGVEAGWPLNQARIRCAGLQVLPPAPEVEEELLCELVGLSETLTPDLEITAGDLVLLDLSRASRAVLATLERLSIKGTPVRWAGAASPDLAQLAACHPALDGSVVAPEDLHPLELSFLGSLGMSAKSQELLSLWGVRTVGEFSALPRQALAERLGQDVVHWQDRVKGVSSRLLRLHRPPASLAQHFEFEEEAETLDPVIFALKRLLHSLASRLASRHLAAGRLDLRLRLVSGELQERRVSLPEPQTQVEAMLSPLQTWLEALRLSSAIASLELDAEATPATASQREWYGRQLPQPERWAATLAKLEALLGPNRVGVPSPSRTHEPDRFTLRPAGAGVGNEATPATMASPPCPVPLSRFRPPRRVAVASETHQEKPRPLALLNGPYTGQIIDHRGPFALSGHWWSPDETWQRLEWDIQLDSHHLLRLAWLQADHWQLEGIYR